MSAGAEKGTTYGAGQTAQQQYDYYKMVYQYAQESIDIGTGLKGVLFWRWAGVDENASLGGEDGAATISASSLLSSAGRAPVGFDWRAGSWHAIHGSFM